jgi:hypothetical protein
MKLPNRKGAPDARQGNVPANFLAQAANVVNNEREPRAVLAQRAIQKYSLQILDVVEAIRARRRIIR